MYDMAMEGDGRFYDYGSESRLRRVLYCYSILKIEGGRPSLLLLLGQ